MHMGFEVRVVAALPSVPSEAVVYELDHQFEHAEHETGSKTVHLVEHVSVASGADAVAFVSALVLDALNNRERVDTEVWEGAHQGGIVSATRHIGELSHRNRADGGAVTIREQLEPSDHVIGYISQVQRLHVAQC